MVNETMISDHYAVTEYIINEKIKRIQELEAINAELLEALEDIDRIASKGDVNIQPLLYYIRERAGATIRQAKGPAR